MIKIVHFLPSLNNTSGIANMIMNYYREIDKKNFKFYFIYFCDDHDKNFKKEIENLNGKYYKICTPKKYFEFRHGLIKIFQIIESDCDDSPIIFHNHQISFTILLYRIVRKYLTKNIIVHNHLTKYSDKLFSSIRNFILCLPIKHLNLKYFACSEDASHIIFGNNKVSIINNGIDVSRYRYNEEKRKSKRLELNIKNEFLIGSIGRLEPQKNYFFAIDIFKEVLKIIPNSKYLIVGKGYLYKELQNYIYENDLSENVFLIGERNDINEMLNAFDLLLFPSLFEGLGIVAIEAQANGVPVIASSSVPKDVQIYNCKRINLNRDKSEWVNEIKKFYCNRVNRKLGYDFIYKSEFNIKSNVKNLEAKYREIIGENI